MRRSRRGNRRTRFRIGLFNLDSRATLLLNCDVLTEDMLKHGSRGAPSGERADTFRPEVIRFD